MQDIKKRLTKGAIWLAATRAIVNLGAFANTLVLARLLVPADFGLVALATTVTAIIASVTELSLASALIQHKDPDEEHFHSAWTLNFARSCLIGLIMAALAVPVARIYSDHRLISVMLAISITTILSGLQNPKLVIFSRDLVFWQEFALGTAQKISGLVVGVVLALIYRSYWALIGGIVAAQLTTLVMSYLLKPYRPRLQLTRVRELLSFSIWLSLAQVANTLNYKFDQLIIGYFLGSTPLGFYTVGDGLAVLPTREATTPLAQTLFPGFVMLADDRQRLRQAYQRAQAMLCAVALPVGFIFSLIAHPLIQLTMGTKWLPTVVIIQFLSAIFALQTLSSSLQPLAMALGETRRLFGRDVLILLVRLPLIIVGLWSDGLTGIVYARCVSGLISTVINMQMVKQILGLSLLAQLMANIRGLLSVTLMIVLTSYASKLVPRGSLPLDLVAQITLVATAGAFIYSASMMGLWFAQGRPAGPESEALRIASSLLRLRVRPLAGRN